MKPGVRRVLIVLFAGGLVMQSALATSRFRNLSVDRVLDNATGLVWQTSPMEDKISYQSASQYCESLRVDDIGDWRLPGIKELASIIDERSYNPAAYHYFRTQPHFYWSATRNAADEKYVWLVNFSDSHIHSFRRDSLFHVRCVSDTSDH
ncbi:MAG: DUF1566 domain-containing protein [Gammaproteobacteria bacterium]|nr:DUF1566 domain-containing protein [Gammaproteobacteria bacterium]